MNDKIWKCQNLQCGAVLGMIRWNGNGSPMLLLLRHALKYDQAVLEEVDVIGPLTGKIPVRCEVCDQMSFWDLSLETLAELIRGLRPQDLERLRALLLRDRVKKVQVRKNLARVR